MKKTFLLLSCAAALTMASCSDNKTETAATTDTMSTAASTTTTDANDATYRSQADATAQRMATDLNVTDTALVSKASDVYYNRARKLADVRSQYTNDTTGLGAAKRAAYLESNEEFHDFLTPEQYTAYTSNPSRYYEEVDIVTVTPAPAPLTPGQKIERAAANVAPGTTVKGADGSKISVDKDGDIKIKDAQGNKAKKAGDDGTVKLKPENGDKVKIN
ncbi:hypothetical protein MUN82_14260 [Hymenobacter aerilatus]|uniref:Lipoprotein n=1 Tax=Hymenobacter aerilatus TaxID=2932251 RepID=A0A8T9SSV2_9BACT|nr:hypothetical protein [Hymenobacter aerilatus]UOR04104.1 hypothetical protein MUN82_14260 [Hymenobacter aerilatus]